MDHFGLKGDCELSWSMIAKSQCLVLFHILMATCTFSVIAKSRTLSYKQVLIMG